MIRTVVVIDRELSNMNDIMDITSTTAKEEGGRDVVIAAMVEEEEENDDDGAVAVLHRKIKPGHSLGIHTYGSGMAQCPPFIVKSYLRMPQL